MIIKKLNQYDYRNHEGISHSDLMIFKRSPSDLLWDKLSTIDKSKASFFDFGSAVHLSLLEQDLFNSDVLISKYKTRSSQGFLDESNEHTGKILLTSDEHKQLTLMTESAFSHPVFKKYMDLIGDNEVSVFSEYDGLKIKCRPDRDLILSNNSIVDVKTTSNIGDWRSNQEWINPLFKFNYGLQACHYLNCCSIHYNKKINNFVFLILSKSVSMGKYPVAVFEITRQELQEFGIWSTYEENLKKYVECVNSNDWYATERFNFYSNKEMEIQYDN